MPQQDVTLQVTVKAPVVPFGSFLYLITGPVVEPSPETDDELMKKQAPPYILPTRTGDIEGPVIYWSAAG